MTDTKHTDSTLKDLTNSLQLKSFLYNMRTYQRNMQSLAEEQTDQIIECAKFICEKYNEQRLKYNKEHRTGGGVFILPNVNIHTKKGRKYLILRWVKFVNGTYLNIPDKKGIWVIREIPKRGQTHYSEFDFEKSMHGKCNDFMTTILEVEHCLRFCREQYAQLKTLYSTSRTLKLKEPLKQLSTYKLDALDAEELKAVDKLKIQTSQGIFFEDPLCVSKKSSLFKQFYTLPEFNDNLDDDLNPMHIKQ